jgi:hypothetical protein
MSEIVIDHKALIFCGVPEDRAALLKAAYPQGLRFPCDSATLTEYAGMVKNLELNLADAAAGLPDDKRDAFVAAMASPKRTYDRAIKAAGDKYREAEAAAMLAALNDLAGK